jgi:hypothetical protein
MTRHQLHEMLNNIPDAKVPRLVRLIQDFIDYDDDNETLSPEELEAIKAANEEIARGELVSFEDVLSRNGLDYKDL